MRENIRAGRKTTKIGIIFFALLIFLIGFWFLIKPFRVKKADEYLKQENLIEYLKAEVLTPFSPLVHYKIALAYNKEGAVELAEKEFKKTISLCERFSWKNKTCLGSFEYKAALFNLKKGKIEAAAKEGNLIHLQSTLAETLELEEGGEANFWLGFLYAALGDYEIAKERIKLPSSAEPLVEEKRQILEDALIKISSRNRLNGSQKDEYPAFLIGLTFLKMNYPKMAIPQFEKSLEIEPNYRDALVELGRSYILLSDYSKAVEYLKKAAEIDPVYPETFYLLSSAYEKMRDKNEAQEATKKAKMLEGKI